MARKHPHGSTLALVSDSSTMRASRHRVEASRLYTSPMFKLASAYAERVYGSMHWGILSAHYGLLRPWEWLEPVATRPMDQLSPSERVAWARSIAARFRAGEYLEDVRRVVLLTGRTYADPLIPHLEAMGVEIGQPLKGLQFSRQFQYFMDREAFHG